MPSGDFAWPVQLFSKDTDAMIAVQGFPKKDARFSKIKNIPDLRRDDKEGKIM